MVQAARTAMLSGDVHLAARYIEFPLEVNAGKRRFHVRNEAELRARWSQIFTPKMVRALREAIPHEMFFRNGMVMLSDGAYWFSYKGLASVNVF